MPGMSWGLVVVLSRPLQHSRSKMPKHLRNVDVKTPNTYVRVCFFCPWASRYQYDCNKPNYRIMSTSVREVRSAAHTRVYLRQRGSKHGIYTSGNGPLSWRAVWLLLASIPGTYVRLAEQTLTGTNTINGQMLCRTPSRLHNRFRK